MTLETLFYKFSGGNDALTMLGAFALLILLNFIAEMWVEIKNKDLRWNDIRRFAHPIFMNAFFLLGLEIVMIPAARVSLAYDIFYNLQMLGWLGVMVYYFYGFYQNLKRLGFKPNNRVDDAIERLTKLEKEKDVE